MRDQPCPSVLRLDRRAFLKGLGSLAVATGLGPIWLDAFGPPSASAATAPHLLSEILPPGTPICVLVTLDGGNDPLNTLVPVGDPWYYDAQVGHGALALTPDTTLPLAGLPYRLHPNLAWLADRWNTRGDVAFVLGVGESQVKSFSHFDAMKFWQTAGTDVLEPHGWLGRYNDLARPGNPLASVSLNGVRRENMGATSPVLVVRDVENFHYALPWFDTADFRAALDLMATGGGAPGFRGQAATLIGTTFDVSARVEGAADPALPDLSPLARITRQLVQAALLIRAGIPCQTYAATFGPFDSHNGQLAMQGDRLRELNEALAAFFYLLGTSGREVDVFVMIVSEFGRKVTANANGGTDHGQGGLAMFLGGGVRGGLYGLAPTLDPGGPTKPNRIHDALRPTVDFRTLHATALGRLGRDPGVAPAVLGGPHEDLGVFSATARVRWVAPAPGSVLQRGAAVTFAWTALVGATQYGFEYTGVNRQFANPNGTGPDPVNGYGGAGGGFLVPSTSLPAVLPPAIAPGSYQVRVIALAANGQLIGTFSDALTVTVA